MSNSFSFRYNSSFLRVGLIPWQFQNKIFRPMKLALGCLGTAVVELLGGEMDFYVSGFVVNFEVEFTFVLANENGSGGAGALREPMDSNRSFTVILTLKIVFAALEIFGHMLDFKSSMSCLGLG